MSAEEQSTARESSAPLVGTAEPISLTPGELLLIVVLGLIWGSAFAVIRLGLLAGASPIAFGVARFAGATAVMAPIALLRRTPLPDRRTLLWSALLGGMLLIGTYAALLYVGEEVISAGLASVLVGSSPIWSTLIGLGLLPMDRMGRRGSFGLLLGFAGLAVLFLPDLLRGAPGATWAALAVLSAAILAALGATLLRRIVQTPPDAWSLTSEFAGATAFLGVLSLLLPGQARLPANANVLLSLLFLIALPSIAGYTIYFRLVHRVGPSRANLVTYVNPLAGIAIGILLLGESPSWSELAGFLLIVLGLFVVQREAARPAAPRPQVERRS
ncbi:MAG: DMT family transporter, partial [Thermoplasmata archaeon]|nr:DMT family transporter [Thermoplasmata archaeon]